MPFCPSCKYEYVSRKKYCPDCGVKLVEKLEKKHIVEEEIIGKEPELVLLHITRSVIYANFLKEGLEQAGIPSLVKSDSGVFLKSGGIISHPLTDFKIYVPKKFWEEGKEIKERLMDNLK